MDHLDSRVPFSLYIPEDLYEKFSCYAACKGLSFDDALELLVLEYIQEFEARHGPIPLDEEE